MNELLFDDDVTLLRVENKCLKQCLKRKITGSCCCIKLIWKGN